MDSKYRPDSFFHLFIGSKDPKVMDVYGKFLDYLIKNINKLPNQRQILNATFEYYLKKIKDYNSQEYRKHRETTDSDIENIQKLVNAFDSSSLRCSKTKTFNPS